VRGYLPQSLINPLYLCSAMYERGNPPAAELCVAASTAWAGKGDGQERGTRGGGAGPPIISSWAFGRSQDLVAAPSSDFLGEEQKYCFSACTAPSFTCHHPHPSSSNLALRVRVPVCACVHTLVLVRAIGLRDRVRGGRGGAGI
jgi:hypothetical protein